jgi:hypothetical protein
VDSLISAEIPDTEKDPELHDLVMKLMIHGPCGEQNPDVPCMVDGKCSKNFPKPFHEHTIMTEDSYAVYRCRDNGKTYEVGHGENKKIVNNRWVIPYYPWLLKKYECHINVECVISIKSTKYIYKYIYKGHDRTTMGFGKAQNEIKLYEDSRFITCSEGAWHLETVFNA